MIKVEGHASLIGPPGSGKTTWARKRAQRWAVADRSDILHYEAERSGSDVVMGIMRVEENPAGGEPLYFNSMLAMSGDEPAFYDKRQLVPDDIARVVLFMASDASSAMTSQSYIVDGGWV